MTTRVSRSWNPVSAALCPRATWGGVLRGSAIALTLITATSAVAAAQTGLTHTVVAGVTHHRYHRKTKAGPMVVNVLRVDPGLATIKSLVAQKPRGGFGRATVSQLAKRYGARAAINGSFFNFVNNEPAGLMVVDGQIISSSPLNRSVFGIRYDGTPFIDDARVRASVLLETGNELPISRVNSRAKPNELTLYTNHFGRSTRTPIEGARYEVAVDSIGTVIEVSNGNLPIPANGYVISANGRALWPLLHALEPGAHALVYTKLSGLWEGVRYAIGGGPTIVHQGRVFVTARQENFGAHIASGRAPRTAIGYTAANTILLVTVDGRQPRYSVGCTLNELARFLIELGCKEAINLDGGGSTVMVVNGKRANRVSAGVERYVSNAIGVFPGVQ